MVEDSKLDEALRSVYDSLTDEQKTKAKTCKSADEIMQLAADEGIELPDEILEAVSGGFIFQTAQGERDPEFANDVYDIINDKTGDVMEGGVVGLRNAEARARALGQRADSLFYNQLEGIRISAKKC